MRCMELGSREDEAEEEICIAGWLADEVDPEQGSLVCGRDVEGIRRGLG